MGHQSITITSFDKDDTYIPNENKILVLFNILVPLTFKYIKNP